MSLQSSALAAAMSATALTMTVTNGTNSAWPVVGATPLSMGVPCIIDGEIFFAVSQPALNTIVIRSRGSDGTAASAHDTGANIAFSNLAGDFPQPQSGTTTTIDPAEDIPISIGQDSTLVLPGATAIYNINKATAACAITLPSPSLADNGVMYTFTSNTAFAHTITVPASTIQDASGVLHTTATFTANKGCSCAFIVENGLYNVFLTSLGVTFS